MRHACAALLMLAAATAAGACDLPDRSAERAGLLDSLAASPDPGTAQAAARAVWEFWFTAPDAAAQAMLDEGVAAIRASDYAVAEERLGALIAYCPGYPEGWNQRAYARFLTGRHTESLADIDEVLKREPAHFGALSGSAMIHFNSGRAGLAQIALRRAISVHPWLPERALIDTESERDL